MVSVDTCNISAISLFFFPSNDNINEARDRSGKRNECGKKDPQELRDFLNDVRQASYSIRNHIERNFGAKEQEYITDEFAIGDPVKIPETKDEKPSEKASGKEKKAKSQPER